MIGSGTYGLSFKWLFHMGFSFKGQTERVFG